jgi:hypothetical protein
VSKRATVEYFTLTKVNATVPTGDLNLMGKNGWKLGGIARVEQLTPNAGAVAGLIIKETVFHYHFWREVG